MGSGFGLFKRSVEDGSASAPGRLFRRIELEPYLVDQQMHVHGVGRRWLKSEALVERARFIVDGMHQEETDSCLVGHRGRTAHRVSEQEEPEALSLNGFVDGKASEEHHRNRVSRHPFLRSTGRFGMIDRSHGERVVADDPLLIGVDDHVGPRRPGPRCRARVPDEPDVQRTDTTFEAVDAVLAIERLRVPESRHAAYSGRGREKRSASSGRRLAGRSIAATISCQASASTMKLVRSARSRSARSRPPSTRNCVRDSRWASAARLKRASSSSWIRRLSLWVFGVATGPLYRQCMSGSTWTTLRC